MPQTPRQTFGFADIRALVARRWWLFVIPFVVIAAGTAIIATSLPDIYRAETVILVDPAMIPERIVQPISSLSGKDRLKTLSQQVMSRTRLEQVIRSLGLWQDDWNDAARMERRVAALKRKIEVSVNGDDSFTIAFEGEDPALVQNITNRLASLFIDENKKYQAEQAQHTTGFIDEQRREIERQLQAKETEIKAFREANLGNLPEQKDTLFRQADNLEARLTANREATLRLSERRAMVNQQLASLRAQLQAPEEVSPLRQELLKLHGEIQVLESQFTDKHPDVILARRRMAEIQALLKSERGKVELPPLSGTEIQRSPMLVGLQRELDQIGLDMAARVAERQTIERQIQEAQARLAGLPAREAQWQALTRDLENLRSTYQSLLGKKIQTELATKVQQEQAGATFNVIDPASLPKTPVRPNRSKIFALGFALAIAAGAGGAYLGEALDQSIRTVEQLKAAYDLPVLGAIPDLTQNESKARRRARKQYLARSAQPARL